jgi:hypothetical protein
MSYPYAHRTRQTSRECIPFKPLGPDDGEAVGGSQTNQISELSTVSTYTVNPVYGSYRLALHAWHNSTTTSAIEFKVRPWVDHGQTIPGPALGMFELGTATIVTALTLDATSVASGKIAQIIPGDDAAGPNPGSSIAEIGPVSHGFSVTMDLNSNTNGTVDFELILDRAD